MGASDRPQLRSYRRPRRTSSRLLFAPHEAIHHRRAGRASSPGQGRLRQTWAKAVERAAADVFGFLIAQIVGATAAIAYLRLVGARPSFIRHAHDFIPQKSGFSAVGMCVLSPPKLYGLSAQTYSTHGLFARRNVPAADHAMVRTLGSSTVNWSCNALPR